MSEEFNPQNTKCIPPVKFFFRLELEQTKQFSNSLLRGNGTERPLTYPIQKIGNRNACTHIGKLATQP
jgi:hypothetical protein